MTSRIGSRRRIAGAAQALAFLALPFVSVRGESALRFDVPTATLFVFGARLGPDQLFVVLPATLFLALAFVLVTLAWGRVWCGWACPQTLLSDLTALAAPGPRGRRSAGRRAAGLALVAVVAATFSAATLWYFVPPRAFLARLAAGALGPALGATWAALAAALFVDLAFVRGRFCATACPYARLQGVLFDRATLVVAYDRSRAADCVDCGACVRVCPTGIDIRHGLQMQCIACAECVDACRPIMARLRRAPDLVGFAWGEPGARRRLVRPATAVLAGGAALALAATIAAAATGAALELTAAPAADFAPRAAGDGRTVNAFQVALENHGDAPLLVRLSVAAPGADAEIRPAEVPLGPRAHRSVRALVSARGLAPGAALRATLSAGADRPGAAPVRAAQEITLVAPEPP